MTNVIAVSERNSITRSNYTDGPCWYVSARDAGRTALVLGPFSTEKACREWSYYTESTETGGSPKHGELLKAVCERDPKAWFYSWGMVKMPNGYRDGVMNVAFPQADRDMHT